MRRAATHRSPANSPVARLFVSMSSTPQGFANRLDHLKSELVGQGSRVQALVELAFEALFARDPARAADAVRLDDQVDAVDVNIERESVQLLADATRQNSQLDETQLRLVLTIVKANNELERIADVGVDLAELLIPTKGARTPVPQPFPDTFRVMANSVVGILRDTNAAFRRDDPALAKVVLQSQHTVTAFKQALTRDAEEQIAKGRMPVDFAFLLHEVANLCELLADHCTNIAEQVIYLRTGAIVRHTQTSWVEVARNP